MFARIICQAFVLSIAFTLVAGQYWTAKFSYGTQCTPSFVWYYVLYFGPVCFDVDCQGVGDLSYTARCVESNPLANLPADFALMTFFSNSNDLSCNSNPKTENHLAVPLDTCISLWVPRGLDIYLKISGCAAQGDTTIITYNTYTECLSNINPTTNVCNPNECWSYLKNDTIVRCPGFVIVDSPVAAPGATPLAVPGAAPIAVPGTAPVAVPGATPLAVPEATPVASTTPDASAPTNNLSSASNIAVGFISVTTAVLVLA